MYKDFEALINVRLNQNVSPKRAVVAGANDEHALEAVFLAQEKAMRYLFWLGNMKKWKK